MQTTQNTAKQESEEITVLILAFDTPMGLSRVTNSLLTYLLGGDIQ